MCDLAFYLLDHFSKQPSVKVTLSTHRAGGFANIPRSVLGPTFGLARNKGRVSCKCSLFLVLGIRTFIQQEKMSKWQVTRILPFPKKSTSCWPSSDLAAFLWIKLKWQPDGRAYEGHVVIRSYTRTAQNYARLIKIPSSCGRKFCSKRLSRCYSAFWITLPLGTIIWT